MPISKLRLVALATLMLFISSGASAQLQNTVCLLKGDLVGGDGQKLSGATIGIYNGTEKVTTTRSNSEGKFTAILKPATTYRVTFTAPMCAYDEETVVVPATDKYLEIPLHAALKAMHDGQPFALAQPVFSDQSATVEISAIPQLDDIINEVKHNPKLSLSITVYPDHPIKSAKKDAKEQQLAASRSNAITSYLMSNGVSEKSYTIERATTVPEGQFPRTAEVVTTKKKKKGVPSLMPQYIQIIARLG
jgi:outer membrane protein OmpA-like peptidoglycan-associated protein